MGSASSKAAQNSTGVKNKHRPTGPIHRISKPNSRPPLIGGRILPPAALHRSNAVKHARPKNPGIAVPQPTYEQAYQPFHPSYESILEPKLVTKKQSPMHNFHKRPSPRANRPSTTDLGKDDLRRAALSLGQGLTSGRDCRGEVLKLEPSQRGRVRAILHLSAPTALQYWPTEEALYRYEREGQRAEAAKHGHYAVMDWGDDAASDWARENERRSQANGRARGPSDANCRDNGGFAIPRKPIPNQRPHLQGHPFYGTLDGGAGGAEALAVVTETAPLHHPRPQRMTDFSKMDKLARAMDHTSGNVDVER